MQSRSLEERRVAGHLSLERCACELAAIHTIDTSDDFEQECVGEDIPGHGTGMVDGGFAGDDPCVEDGAEGGLEADNAAVRGWLIQC